MNQRSLRAFLALGAAAFIGLASLTACGADPAQRTSEPRQPTLDLSAEEQALGIEAEPAAHPSRDADKPGRGWGRHKGTRGFFGHKILHGELVIDGKDGPRTIAVQRGTVTKADDSEITVKSADGFSLTWKLGEKLRVIERRGSVKADDLDVGDVIALAGPKSGDTPTARLIVISRPR
ncbi:MAG: hypothetical protein GEU94_04720 [Micromonosporaceae bacterium]|nr:hypothetical protein [Micromonosporaceae bacterium]